MWVIRCSKTNEFVVDSEGKNIDKLNIDNAKVFKTLSGAKSSRSYFQDIYDARNSARINLFNLGKIPSLADTSPKDCYERKWSIHKVDIKIHIDKTSKPL